MADERSLNDEERDELVAYLDGELDEQAARDVEARLGRDPRAKAEAEALRRTWNLLDYLPRPEPSGDFTHRTKVVLNTSAQGVETKEALSGVVVPVRLHSGNFDFLGAKPDGADLRVIAADDKTPLKHWVERFDGVNELAVVWVQLPNTLPGTDKNIVYVYAGNEAAAAEAPNAALFDGAMAAAFPFSGQSSEPVADATNTIQSAAALARETTGLIGPSGKLDGQAVTWTNDKLKAGANAPYSISLWFKPEAVTGTLVSQGALSLKLDGGKPSAALGTTTATGGELPTGAWAYLALTIGNGLLYGMLWF